MICLSTVSSFVTVCAGTEAAIANERRTPCRITLPMISFISDYAAIPRSKQIYEPGFPFWLLNWAQHISPPQVLVLRSAVCPPGAFFCLYQAPIPPRRKNQKPGNCLFLVTSTNTSPTSTSWSAWFRWCHRPPASRSPPPARQSAGSCSRTTAV